MADAAIHHDFYVLQSITMGLDLLLVIHDNPPITSDPIIHIDLIDHHTPIPRSTTTNQGGVGCRNHEIDQHRRPHPNSNSFMNIILNLSVFIV